LWQQHIWAKTCKNNEKKKQQQQLLVQILVAAPLPIFHFARGSLWITLNGFFFRPFQAAAWSWFLSQKLFTYFELQ